MMLRSDQIKNEIKQCEDIIAKLNTQLTALNEELGKITNENLCGKILYISKEAAGDARELINRDLVKAGKDILKKTYYCPQCKAWHLATHKRNKYT